SNTTVAVASASSPATVYATAVFSALLIRLSGTLTARSPPTSAVVSSVRDALWPFAWLPAVSVADTDTVIDPSLRPERPAVPSTPAAGRPSPSSNATVAVASLSSPATVYATDLFSVLLMRLSGTLTARSPPASAVVSSVSDVPWPVAWLPAVSVAETDTV